MNTTSLFVELVVVGSGALAWLMLLILTLFGYHWLSLSDILTSALSLAVLPVTYVLGIVTDRAADTLFQRWSIRILQRFFESPEDYFDAIHTVHSVERLADILEYGRSRMRICRGWCLNALMGAVLLQTMFWFQLWPVQAQWWKAVAGSVLLLMLCVACWFAWRSLLIAGVQNLSKFAVSVKRDGNDAAI